MHNLGASYRIDFHKDFIPSKEIQEKEIKKQERRLNKSQKNNKKAEKKRKRKVKRN